MRPWSSHLRLAVLLLGVWAVNCDCGDEDPTECEGADCDAGPGPRDASSSGCMSDSDCATGIYRFCEGGFCTACRADEHCTGATPLCISGNRCGECRNDADCPMGSLCTSTGVCAQCTKDCSNGLPPYCCLQNDVQTCCECLYDSHCVGNPDETKCSPQDKVCYECLVDADCDPEEQCLAHVCYVSPRCNCSNDGDCASCQNRESRVCINDSCQACRTDTDCPGTSFCFELGGTPLCGVCRTDQDCMDNPKFPGYPNCRSADAVCCADNPLVGGCIACRNDDDCGPNQVCEEREGYIACWPL